MRSATSAQQARHTGLSLLGLVPAGLYDVSSCQIGAQRTRQVMRIIRPAHLPGRMHRQQPDTDIHRRDPQPGGRDGADGRPARHRIVRDEHLGWHPGGLAGPQPEGLAHGVRRIPLAGVYLQHGAAARHQLGAWVVVLGIVGMHQVSGIRRDAGAPGEQGLRRIKAETGDGGDPLQHVPEEWPGRPGAGRGPDLLVVEGSEDHQVIPIRQVLHGRQPGVGAGEVVQASRREELAVQPEAGGRLGRVGEQVVAQDVAGLHPGLLGEGRQQIGFGVEGEHRLGVGLAVEREAVVDAPVQVNGQLWEASDGVEPHQVLGAVAGDDAPGDAELPVQPRVEQRAAVDLDGYLPPAAAAEAGLGLDLQRRGVGVGSDDAQPGGIADALRLPPGNHSTVPDNEEPAGPLREPRPLVYRIETGIDEAQRDALGRVIARWGGCHESS